MKKQKLVISLGKIPGNYKIAYYQRNSFLLIPFWNSILEFYGSEEEIAKWYHNLVQSFEIDVCDIKDLTIGKGWDFKRKDLIVAEMTSRR